MGVKKEAVEGREEGGGGREGGGGEGFLHSYFIFQGVCLVF